MLVRNITDQLWQVEFLKKSLNHKVTQSLAYSSMRFAGNYRKQMFGTEITGLCCSEMCWTKPRFLCLLAKETRNDLPLYFIVNSSL